MEKELFHSQLSPNSRGIETSFFEYEREGDGSYSLPTKIAIAGSDWSATFQLPIKKIPGGMYAMKNFEFSDVFVDWFKEMPAVSVFDVTDAIMIEMMLRKNRRNSFFGASSRYAQGVATARSKQIR